MKAPKKIREYMRDNFTEVLHTTLNPEGPGVVRIHLIPPKYDEQFSSSVAIINGQDIVPINFAWSIVLAELIKEINKYDGKETSDEDVTNILEQTSINVKKIFPLIPKNKIKKDAYRIMNTFKQIAYHEDLDEEIFYMNIGEYADHMRAPHRMDVMVSAMSKDGKWHCNQKCLHCYAAGQKHSDEKEMTTEQWKSAIDKLREIGVPQITFTGGEPTMREDLFELIAYARWFISRLNTNGIKLTKDYCEELKKAEIDSVQITFYDVNEEVHNKLVGAKQYKHTVDGIKNAIACGLNLSINTPLCTLNKDYVKTLEFLHELGVTYVTCSGLITTGNATKDGSVSLQLSKDEIKDILDKACEYCYSHGMEVAFTSPGWIEEEFFLAHGIPTPNCGACLSNMALTPSGNVVPCQSWLSGDILGNILTDDWNSIWDNPICKKRRGYSSLMLGTCPLRRYQDEK